MNYKPDAVSLLSIEPWKSWGSMIRMNVISLVYLAYYVLDYQLYIGYFGGGKYSYKRSCL